MVALTFFFCVCARVLWLQGGSGDVGKVHEAAEKNNRNRHPSFNFDLNLIPHFSHPSHSKITTSHRNKPLALFSCFTSNEAHVTTATKLFHAPRYT